MASRSAAAQKTGKGQAAFVVHAENETLQVHLDRQGFRRLLETLEQLAQSGDDQAFEKSGRQQKKKKNRQEPEGVAITKLLFSISEATDR